MAANNKQRKRISKTTAKKNHTTKKKSSGNSMRREVRVVIMGFISLVILLSYYTSCFGIFGNFMRNTGLALLGASAYALPVLVSAILIHKGIKTTLSPYAKVYTALSFVLVCTSLLNTIIASEGVEDYLASTSFFESARLLIEGGIDCVDGGIIGALGIPLKSFFGSTGSIILLSFIILLLVAFSTKFLPIIWLFSIVKRFASMVTENLVALREKREQQYDDVEYDDEEEEEEPVPRKQKKLAAPRQTELDLDRTEPTSGRHRVKKDEKKSAPFSFGKQAEKEPVRTVEKNTVIQPDTNISIFLPGDDVKFNEYKQEESIAPIPEEAPTPAPVYKKEPNIAIELTEDEFITETKPYEFPPLSLLDRHSAQPGTQKGPDLREQARVLVDTLRSFGVEAKILEVNKGPAVTRFELQPATGVKVSKITGLADDIALNLAAMSVRIEAPIPGKAAIGIEIPNAGNSIVHLSEVLSSESFTSFKAKTAFALGKDIAGTPVVTDISKMPHMLIAGATGSGKSVCINSLITSILYKADPKEVKFIMIDPKVVELSVYNGIPHLLIPVVTDPRKAAGALNWAVQEMTKRYKMFADSNVRDIKGYNELAEFQGEKKLEQIIIIVDELADLMMVAPRDVEDAICRLAQMARAAGMHLVIATQRPSVDVITGIIKANVPSRIAFAVSSQVDSRTILDMGGAEKLLGKGDMLFLPMGAAKPTRIQGAFISDKEVERVVSFVKQDDIKYDEDVIEKIEKGITADKEESGGDADELLPKAIEIVVEAGQASASLLQRRLSVGYSRAGRLIDQLEARGIIGPHEGAKPRAVLMSRAEYAEMMMQSE